MVVVHFVAEKLRVEKVVVMVVLVKVVDFR